MNSLFRRLLQISVALISIQTEPQSCSSTDTSAVGFSSCCGSSFPGPLRSNASSLKCYMCNSKEDSRCINPLDESNTLQLTNCSNDEQQRAQTRNAIEEISNLMAKLGQSGSMSFSSKRASQQWEDEKYPIVCQKLVLNVEGNEVIGRGCSAPRMENFDPCYAVKLITSKDIVLKSCSLCDTDGCNKGIRNHFNFLHVIIPTIIFFLTTRNYLINL